MARRHPALRPIAVPPDRRLGGQIPRRAVGQPDRRKLLGARLSRSGPTGFAWAVDPVFEALRSVSLLRIGLPPACVATRSRLRRRRPRAILDLIWIALIAVASPSGRSGASSLLSAPTSTWPDVVRRHRPDVLHLDARRRADGAGDARLGADQRLDRPQPALGRTRAAVRAVSRRLSRSICCSAPRSASC